MTPIIVRTMDSGKYEILSGHNRVYAAGQAGITSVPAVVKTDLSDEEAEVYVIETNLLQRSFQDLKISEQAFAVGIRYSKLFDERKLKAISDELYFIENGKHKPEAEQNVPVEHLTTRDATAEEYGISSSKVARLLRVNKLIDEFKALVDKGNIKLRSAVDISFMPEEQQKLTYSLTVDELYSGISITSAAKQFIFWLNGCRELIVWSEDAQQMLYGLLSKYEEQMYHKIITLQCKYKIQLGKASFEKVCKRFGIKICNPLHVSINDCTYLASVYLI